MGEDAEAGGGRFASSSQTHLPPNDYSMDLASTRPAFVCLPLGFAAQLPSLAPSPSLKKLGQQPEHLQPSSSSRTQAAQLLASWEAREETLLSAINEGLQSALAALQALPHENLLTTTTPQVSSIENNSSSSSSSVKGTDGGGEKKKEVEGWSGVHSKAPQLPLYQTRVSTISHSEAPPPPPLRSLFRRPFCSSGEHSF